MNSNGKEKDYESGFHYYGARYYWSEVLTGWLSVDPMMDKYPNLSPYSYCAWNPLKIIDIEGKDTLLFSHNGYYEKTLPGGVNIGIVRGEDGNYSKKFTFADERWCGRFVKMDDLELAVENNKHGRDDMLFNRVIELDNDFIDKMLDDSGVNKWYLNCVYSAGLLYALLESRSGRFGEQRGRLDFVNRKEIQREKGALFVITAMGTSMAHDNFNLGNFLWGAAMGRMNIFLPTALFGAHLDCIIKEKKFDSADDQRSICQGYYYGLLHK